MNTASLPDQVIQNRDWARWERPFPHVVVDNAFTQDFYDQLVGAANETLSGGKLKHASAHDIMVHPVTDSAGWPLSFFFTEPWQQLLAELFQLPRTDEVVCAIHHHTVGSANGFPHNDLRRDWLAGTALADPSQGAEPPASVRGVAVVYYLANPPWRAGDGGETGLYRSGFDRVDRPARAVAPVNNRLLAFGCSPLSFHAFRTNRRTTRNSIVMWTHQRTDELVDRWRSLLGLGDR
jgi:hypothetical protein